MMTALHYGSSLGFRRIRLPRKSGWIRRARLGGLPAFAASLAILVLACSGGAEDIAEAELVNTVRDKDRAETSASISLTNWELSEKRCTEAKAQRDAALKLWRRFVEVYELEAATVVLD